MSAIGIHDLEGLLTELSHTFGRVISNWTGERMSSSGPDTSSRIREAMPLRIRGFHLTDPVLTLWGEEWDLTLWATWRIDVLGFGWGSEDLEGRAWDLIGLDIESLSVTGTTAVTFHLTGGVDLALDETGNDDPRVLRVPGDLIYGGAHGPLWT